MCYKSTICASANHQTAQQPSDPALTSLDTLQRPITVRLACHKVDESFSQFIVSQLLQVSQLLIVDAFVHNKKIIHHEKSLCKARSHQTKL